MGDIFCEHIYILIKLFFFVQSIIETLHGYRATEKKVLYYITLEQKFNCTLNRYYYEKDGVDDGSVQCVYFYTSNLKIKRYRNFSFTRDPFLLCCELC